VIQKLKNSIWFSLKEFCHFGKLDENRDISGSLEGIGEDIKVPVETV
jgi:hypothetical protein